MRQARVVQRLGRDFQQQPLLRVHLRGFARRDAEGARVEARDLGEDAGGEAQGAAGFAAARVEQRSWVKRSAGTIVTASRPSIRRRQ